MVLKCRPFAISRYVVELQRAEKGKEAGHTSFQQPFQVYAGHP